MTIGEFNLGLVTFPSEQEDPFPPELENLTGHPLTEARLCAVQAVFAVLVDDSLARGVESDFLNHQVRHRKADKKLFSILVKDALGNKDRYQEIVAGSLSEEWPYDRVGLVEKAIFLTACAELFTKPETPLKVIVNEYLNISKGFLADDGCAFVNGVLDAVAKKIRPAA